MSKQHQNVAPLRELARRCRGAYVGQQSAEALLQWAVAVCEAADNLVNVKGRHHAEVAYRRLENAVNAKEEA